MTRARLCGGDRLERVPLRLPGARPDLDEHAGALVVGDEIELARVGAVLPPVARDDPKAQRLEKSGGQALGADARGLRARRGDRAWTAVRGAFGDA